MGKEAPQSPHFFGSKKKGPVVGDRHQRPGLSVVVPLFNEQASIAVLWRRLEAVFDTLEMPCEAVLVDDGSQDETPRLIRRLQGRDARVTLLRLSRNFGHQAAVSAGLKAARGRCVVVMDGDLQDPPELIRDMLDLWKQGWDVVYAVRRRRQEAVWKRVGYGLFYRILARISEMPIPLDSGDFCLMDRKVVRALNRLPERCRFVRGLRSYLGFRQTPLEYDRPGRAAGQSKYSFGRLAKLAIEGLVSFSALPLRVTTMLGALGTVVALVLAGWAVHDALTRQTAPQGWSSTLVIVLFMGSMQLLSLGVIGEYLRLIFLESKQRPPYVVAELRRGGIRKTGQAAHRNPAQGASRQ